MPCTRMPHIFHASNVPRTSSNVLERPRTSSNVHERTSPPLHRFYDSSALQRGHPHALSLTGCILPFRSSIGVNSREENTTSALVACKDVPLFCVGSTVGEIALISHTGHLVARLDANLTSAIIPGPPPLAWPTWLARTWSQSHSGGNTTGTHSTAAAAAAATASFQLSPVTATNSTAIDAGPSDDNDHSPEVEGEDDSDQMDPTATFFLTGTASAALTSPSRRRRRLVPATISTPASTEDTALPNELSAPVVADVLFFSHFSIPFIS
jgi:hypothetical protein